MGSLRENTSEISLAQVEDDIEWDFINQVGLLHPIVNDNFPALVQSRALTINRKYRVLSVRRLTIEKVVLTHFYYYYPQLIICFQNR